MSQNKFTLRLVPWNQPVMSNEGKLYYDLFIQIYFSFHLVLDEINSSSNLVMETTSTEQ